MRLVEFLFQDPGTAPDEPRGRNTHMPYQDPRVADLEPFPHDDYFAGLSGGPVYFHSRHDIPRTMGGGQYDGTVYDEREAIAYRHYLGEAIDTDDSGQIDEVLKGGVQSRSAGDNRAIKALETGKYPGRAEDGKGFCFHWADGRGICAFRFRNDALRWAKAEPRDIVRFWYGEPLHNNGKFRIRVSDRYRKEESVVGFSEFLAEATTDRYKLDRVDKAEGYKLYLVDAAKWGAYWKRAAPGAHVGKGGSGGIGRRYVQFGEWLNQEPLVVRGKVKKPGRADSEKIIAPTGFVTRGARGLNVGFDNGRHRFAVMRDRGERVVIALKPEMAELGHAEGFVKRETSD